MYWIKLVNFREGKQIQDSEGKIYKYKGEVDQNKKACGKGLAAPLKSNFRYKGTFFEDRFEGLGKFLKLFIRSMQAA